MEMPHFIQITSTTRLDVENIGDFKTTRSEVVIHALDDDGNVWEYVSEHTVSSGPHWRMVSMEFEIPDGDADDSDDKE